MAHMRTLKPQFFLHEELAEIEPLGRLLFEGLWRLADRMGRLQDRPRRVETEALLYDDVDVDVDVDALLDQLHQQGFVQRYAVSSHRYIQMVILGQWQPFGREKPADWEALRRAVFERDGYIRRYCGQHTDEPHCGHVISVSRGRLHDSENLVSACPVCNLAKGAKTDEEW